MLHPLALQMPSLPELLVILGIGVLFFGKRLPEVGKSLGKGIVEFKKGLKSIEEEVDTQVNAAPPPPSTPNPNHKFDPYTGKPVQTMYDPYTGKPINQDSANTANSSQPQSTQSV
jgi:sec-independent protein translocase protein TatA